MSIKDASHGDVEFIYAQGNVDLLMLMNSIHISIHNFVFNLIPICRKILLFLFDEYTILIIVLKRT